MLKVVYDKDGSAVGDFELESEVEEIIGEMIDVYHTCTELMISYFRIAVKEGKISHNDIIFEIDGKEIRCDKFGNLERYPFNSPIDDSLDRLVDW